MIKHIAYLFDKVNNDVEVAKWIRTFGSYGGTFGVIKISGASLYRYLDNLCEDLAVLSKLDLNSPVVYGWGDAFSQKLDENGIQSEKHPISGVRITKKEDLPFLEEIVEEQGSLIVDKLKSKGVSSKIVYNVFTARTKKLEGVIDHYTGEVIDVNTQPIIETINSGRLPIIPPLGYNNEGQLLNINADTASKGLVSKLQPRRYILITNTGGILDSQGNLITEICLTKDYQKLIEQGVVSGGMKVKIDEIKETIVEAPQNYILEVQIAHPKNLLEELFTDVGKGTYIRR
jgi:bifunctional N-acetylglutamate synthase/kinase